MLVTAFILFFVFLMLGVPIAFSLGLGSVVAIFMDDKISSMLVAQKLFSSINSFSLMAIPFFMLSDALLKINRKLVADVLEDFNDVTVENARTNGERLYALYGMKGARGEALSGYHTVLKKALPVLKHQLDRGLSLNDAGAVTLLYIMAHSEDTNIVNRSSYHSMKKIQSILRETLQTVVIYASSQEAGEGDASHLTDGDPNTIWHTMYSVTVAKYPHWVDLDAGEVKNIKGFIYLPRQDGNNGKIKDYSIQVSMDGKNWGTPVQKGTFDNSSKEKQVEFAKPVQARYIRFTALSEQNGQDFASGAEITILAE